MKRFVSTEKWGDPWYRKLSPQQKCFWEWLCAQCDHAGSVDIDFELASFQIGAPVTISDISAFGDRITRLDSGRYFITGFIAFQYGKLSSECKAHGPVFRALADRCIPYQVGYQVGYSIPSKTGQGQDKDKDKEKDKDPCGSIPEQQTTGKYHSVAVLLVDEFRAAKSRDPAYRMSDNTRLRSITAMEAMLERDGYTPTYIKNESKRLYEAGKNITTVEMLRRAINERWGVDAD
jgi:hypothetical protein